MKTRVLFLFFLSLNIGVYAQKYSTKNGVLPFEVSAPKFEPVHATNNKVSAILNIENGDFVVLALVQGFRFKVASVEEHFNENYIESNQFPKATLRGKITHFVATSLSEEPIELRISGTINMHGTDKLVEIPISISSTNGQIILETKFVLKPEDFSI